MHEFSLIIATHGERPEDLRSLLYSLIPQADRLADVIVVDQNPDLQRIPELLQQFHSNLPVRYTRSQRGLSQARNCGLPMATGQFVAFPDDDCLYPENLLCWIVNWFAANRGYSVLAVGAMDSSGIPSGNRWLQSRCDITPLNALRTTFSPSLFLRTGVAKTQRFDVRLGVGSGTPYGSGEETDYVLRLIHAGAMARFDRTRHIIHPRRDMLSSSSSAQRAQSYGLGMGHLLRLHTLSAYWLGFMAYNLARAGWAFGRGDRAGSQLCLAQTKGLWQGFLAPVDAAVASRAATADALKAAMQNHPRSLNPM